MMKKLSHTNNCFSMLFKLLKNFFLAQLKDLSAVAIRIFSNLMAINLFRVI